MAGPFARLRRGGDAEAEAATSFETATDATAGDAGTNPKTELTAAPPTEVIGAVMATPGDGARATADTAVLAAVVEQAPPEAAAAGTELVPADLPPDAAAPADQPAGTEPATEPAAPTFLARGRMRRRLRYVRRAREVALRDLGGLVFDMHRFGRDRNDLVDQKLTALSALDAEMRALGQALEDPDGVTVLREPGLASCARCGALHASDAHFCSTCGLPVGKGAGLPAGPTFAGPAPSPAAAAPAADGPTAGGEPPAPPPS
ncbi:zinc ribbon domain-containing protein [Capillimicrobium parvum]|uniref:Zinc ribbon domain-containing protein n=1 Tax=Capillimicrobium parvum TaxID=2884022 RepID=A0A9E7C1P2_9ACTN|nr:zinc ribbon domain-containing protein [Capillimicrobium parvum]UGS37695.1 hypothetical protein DSM104329_04115 [Capillimicrobium parvum]